MSRPPSETSGETQYFSLGGQLHPGIFVNTGYVRGRSNALPTGVTVGDRITDPNALANLQRRSAGGVFLGLSFTFLGGGETAFGKPLAGAETER